MSDWTGKSVEETVELGKCKKVRKNDLKNEIINRMYFPLIVGRVAFHCDNFGYTAR